MSTLRVARFNQSQLQHANKLIIWVPSPSWVRHSILEEKKGGAVARVRYVGKGKKVITSGNKEA